MHTQRKLDRRSFLAGLGGVFAAFSGSALSFGAPATQPLEPARSIGRLGDINENTIFDLCIIGSGFAGAILGSSLVGHGIRTVILESGPDPRGKAVDSRFQQLDRYRSSGPIDYPLSSTRFRALGGTSWLWGGNCTRLHPEDFEKNSYTPAGAPWPLSYADLEPYYEQAEKTLRVRGGKRTEYDPPRKTAYPLPPEHDVSALEALLNRVGVTISDKPYSTPLQRDPAVLSGRDGPFLQMTESHLPSFQSSPYAALIPEATVTRLLVNERGYVTGAEVKDLDRQVRTVRARVYVVACGGLESPRLLLLSHSRDFPNGIGNGYGWVGRCFMEHRPVRYTSRIKLDWSSFNLFQLSGYSYQFYKQFKEQSLGGMRLGFYLERAIGRESLYPARFISGRFLTRRLGITIGTEMKPSAENRVTLDKKLRDYFGNPATNLFLHESEDDARTLHRAKQIVRQIYTKLGAEEVEELPRNFWAHHHMGTCRMGDNPRLSVVDRDLRVHGSRNLFVAGSAVFVTSGTAHPTLNLSALSLRLADHLREQLRDGAFPAPRTARRQGS